MSIPIPITNTDYTAEELHKLATQCNDGRQAQRIRGIAMVLNGTSRNAVAAALGTTAQSIRDWVLAFNRNGLDGLRDAPRSGRPRKLTEDQREQVCKWVEDGPDLEKDDRTHWRLEDLVKKISETFDVVMSRSAVGRMLKAMGFSHIMPRPIHPKTDPAKQEEFRNDFNALAANCILNQTFDITGVCTVPSPSTSLKYVAMNMQDTPIEVWFQDEARAGQKGTLTRIWARTGTRPRVVRDHRYGYAYLFSAACGDRGVGVSHVCDRANTEEMNRHLADISEAVAPGAFGLVVLDGAGWHRSKALEIPSNLALLHLPPYSPELNPMETVFAYLRSNFLSNRVFETVEDVRAGMAQAWEKFAADSALIKSIMKRDWATI